MDGPACYEKKNSLGHGRNSSSLGKKNLRCFRTWAEQLDPRLTGGGFSLLLRFVLLNVSPRLSFSVEVSPSLLTVP